MTFNEFQIKKEIKENRLLCEIIIDEAINSSCKYAFYLIHNGSKVATKNYSNSNHATFNLIENGQYQVVGFVMKNEQRYSNKSEIMEFTYDERYPIHSKSYEEEKIGISIFGSCVTRDILEYDADERFELKTYIARQSIISAVSEPVDIKIDDIHLSSKFKKQCIYNDFTKNTFDVFKADNSQYLIIDLIDERFKLIKCKSEKRNSIVTFSSELLESGYFKHPRVMDKKLRRGFGRDRYYLGTKLLDQYIKAFVKEIKNIYQESHIIIHVCKMSNTYITDTGEKREFPRNYHRNTNNTNRLLDYMYKCLIDNLPEAKVIDLGDQYYADENHKWGLAPMHYQKEYYIEVIKNMKEYFK